MISLINHLQIWIDKKKLINYDNNAFYQLVQDYIKKINSSRKCLDKNTIFKVILAEKDSYKFLAAFLASVITKNPVFLANPDWKEQEWQQVLELVKPELVLGINQSLITNISGKKTITISHEYLNQSLIMIPTGGSSGKIQFTIHTWESLTASIRGFQQYFELETIDSFCLLPLYHVSGLIQFLRSFLTLGDFLVLPYSSFKKNPDLSFEYQSFFISLVPKQCQFILDNYPDWLAQFQTVLLGGAPAWPDLLEKARKKEIKLALTYGMTETASQIVTLKPKDFLSGNNNVGQVLPHAQVKICDDLEQELPINQTGIITIRAESLFLGYYPNFNHSNFFQTDDLGFFDDRGYLTIIGRNSQKIITGGENVFPSEIESAILATNLVKDIVIIGLPNVEWGEIVTAIYVPNLDNFNLEHLQTILKTQLSNYKCPKQWLEMKEIPRSQQGKINYQVLKEYAQRELVKSGDSFL